MKVILNKNAQDELLQEKINFCIDIIQKEGAKGKREGTAIVRIEKGLIPLLIKGLLEQTEGTIEADWVSTTFDEFVEMKIL